MQIEFMPMFANAMTFALEKATTEGKITIGLIGITLSIDNLADLKDNKLKPALDRLSRSIGAYGSGADVLSPEYIENIRIALLLTLILKAKFRR